MQLTSRDGVMVELRPIAYEFGANPRAKPGTDWDANWLIIRGNVTVPDGPAWTFLDPCLTTWEARTVSKWLRGVVDGRIQPLSLWPAEMRSDEPHFTFFTEPNVALSLEGRTADRARLRVHFSLEALPPTVTGDLDLFAYFLIVDTSIDEVAAAADEWDAHCLAFPVR